MGKRVDVGEAAVEGVVGSAAEGIVAVVAAVAVVEVAVGVAGAADNVVVAEEIGFASNSNSAIRHPEDFHLWSFEPDPCC